MSEDKSPESFDPRQFFELARRVGHGRALGLEFRDSGSNWTKLALPWREEFVGVPATGALSTPKADIGG